MCSGFAFSIIPGAAVSTKIDLVLADFTGTLSAWFGTYSFDLSYGIGDHTFTDMAETYTINIPDPCPGTLLSWDETALVYDTNASAYLSATAISYDASTRTS